MAQVAGRVLGRLEGFLQIFVRVEGFFVIFFSWEGTRMKRWKETFNIQHSTFNIQHSTPNIEAARAASFVQCWKLNVHC
jgi:hypothetical protein